MKKRIYIQPQMETVVMPKEGLMQFPASPTINPAPAHRNVAPASQPGPSGVWL